MTNTSPTISKPRNPVKSSRKSVLTLRQVLPPRHKVKVRKGNGLMPSRPHKDLRRERRGDWKRDVLSDLS